MVYTTAELTKWERIYDYADKIAALEPWKLFSEDDLFVYISQKKENEHFFAFLEKSIERKGIAIYQGGNNCFHALNRLHSRNPKKEPVFYLQNAIMLLWDDRENIGKSTYALLKQLNRRYRGKGKWLHFALLQEGYLASHVPSEQLDELLDDLENLWEMVLTVINKQTTVNFSAHQVVTRRYSAEDGQYCTYSSVLRKQRIGNYSQITVAENDWLRHLHKMVPRGTISMDWSYLPIQVENDSATFFPRLILAVENREGKIIHKSSLPPSARPYDGLLHFFDEIIALRGKPSVIEISSREMEAYLADLCQKTGIRLVVKDQLKPLFQLQKQLISRIISGQSDGFSE